MAEHEHPDVAADRRMAVADEERTRERALEDRVRHTPADLDALRAEIRARQERERRELEERQADERVALGAHSPGCRRPWHSGPCVGVLRVDDPPTPLEYEQRREDAVAAVLMRDGVRGRYGWEIAREREVLAELVAAADTGI